MKFCEKIVSEAVKIRMQPGTRFARHQKTMVRISDLVSLVVIKCKRDFRFNFGQGQKSATALSEYLEHAEADSDLNHL